jgi:hypothetical protein
MPSRLYFSSTNHEPSEFGFLGLIWAMIKVMVGSAGASPKRVTSPEPASVTEPTHVPAHRRFNRSSAAYDAAIGSELLREQQSRENATERVFAQTRLPAKKNRLVVPLLFVGVLLIAATVTFALAYLRDHHLTPADTASLQALPAQNARLGMRARQQGEDLLVSWDGTSQAVQSATDGLLQIDDGAQHREIALDRAGIASRSMLYKPTSEDVVFRLEVRGKEGVHAAESLEVVGTRPRSADLEASRTPAAAPEVTPKPSRPKAENSLPTTLASNRRGSKKVNAGRLPSQPVSRRAPKVIEAAGRAFRAPNQPLSAEKAPSLSIASVTAAQPSPLSGQQLPKPPPQTSSTATKSANNTNGIAGSPAEAPSSVRGSISTNGMSSAAASYIPPRPLKWTAPNAKSLGLSKMAAATDVQIKVRIDDSGHVTAAHALLDGSPHDEALTGAVTAAVKQWIFEPAKMHGKNVPSEETVVIRVGPRE